MQDIINTVSITYTLANGQKVQLNVTLDVAHTIKAENNKNHAQRMERMRHMTMEGYTEGSTELISAIPLPEVETIVEKREAYHNLYIALSKLTSKQRRRIIQYYFYNRSFRQIAHMEKVHVSSVEESIKSALTKMKKSMDDCSSRERIN